MANKRGKASTIITVLMGYHPLLCYDGLTGDLLKAELRIGTAYSSTGVVGFMQPLLDEYSKEHPDTQLFLRCDSGFATPDLLNSVKPIVFPLLSV